jgi:hypothetical protein
MDRVRELALRTRLRVLGIRAPDRLISALVELGDELPSDDIFRHPSDRGQV